MMVATVLLFLGGVSAQEADKKPAQEADQKKSSYMSVDIKEDFAEIMTRMKRAKPEVMQRQMDLLKARYDLSNRPAKWWSQPLVLRETGAAVLSHLHR